MRVLKLHDWNISTAEAGRLQRDLAPSVVRSRCVFQPLRYVAGVDVSVDRINAIGRAAVVVLSYPELKPVEVKSLERRLEWPYVPGFLSFRELPLLLDVFEMIDIVPDLVLVDGHGVAHPRRFGIACHLGLFLDIPTIGCAKSLLCGTHGPLGAAKGSVADIIDHDEVVGVAVRTRDAVKPVYVSIGHMCGFADSVESVLHCTGKYRLPEPTRVAHLAAGGRVPF
ncbi:MAG: deoxyribonuclease V [Dehalococcoidia bacterium]|nr:deoxyribonuclease V [Dehalococcoidia bacterium]